jgi:hypothetical protein
LDVDLTIDKAILGGYIRDLEGVEKFHEVFQIANETADQRQ